MNKNYETLQIGDVINWDGELMTVKCMEDGFAVWYGKPGTFFAGKRIARCNIHDYGRIKLVRRAGKPFPNETATEKE